MKLFLICLLTLSCGLCALGQDSLNVRRVGWAHMDQWGYVCAVAIQGNYAYVATNTSGLRVVDISNPTTPTEVGFHETPGEAIGVAVSGNYAYVANDHEGLWIIDITNPSVPTETGFCDTPALAVGVAVNGNYAYVANAESGLRIIDITNPATPTETGFCDAWAWDWDVAVSGNYAYAADGGLRIIDVTNPASPTETSFLDSMGFTYSVAVSGNYALLAGGSSGLRVIDITNPTAPVETGFYETPGAARGVAVSGALVYVADWSNLGIYDCSAAMSASGPFIPHPSSFILSAFPNPFNSTTSLRLDLPREVKVRLAVYDVLGREVTTLKDGVMGAGTHNFRFDAQGLASGMYVIRLSAADFSQSRKITLVR